MQISITIPNELTDEQRLRVVRSLASGVVIANQCLIRHGYFGDLYDYVDRVVWAPEPPGEETIVDGLTVLKRGWGDCAHLAAMRVAWLRELLRDRIIAGKADPKTVPPNMRLFLRKKRPGKKKRVMHALVRHEDHGRLEDPSRFLGMADRQAR